jgi:hypothetical protein
MTDMRAPFRFGGVDYHTIRDLAEAFAASASPWLSPADYLDFIQAWLGNNLMFEEALRLKDEAAGSGPELALFRFVHSAASLPFCAMGHIVDVNNIYIFMRNVIRGEASETQTRITDMLSDGRLVSYYGEYARYAKPDPTFRDALALLCGKTAYEQFAYAEALIRPDDYIWPSDAERGDIAGLLATVKKIGTPPQRRDIIDDMERVFVLPDDLHRLLSYASSYEDGVRRLEYLKSSGLLMPRGPDENAVRNMSLEGYERAARVKCYGHTPKITRDIKDISDAIESLNEQRPEPVFYDALKYLGKIGDRKITASDRAFIGKISDLLTRRESITSGAWGICAYSAAAATMILFFARVISSFFVTWDDVRWTFVGALVLVGACLINSARGEFLRSILWSLQDETEMLGTPYTRRIGPVGIAIISIMALFYFMPEWLPNTLPASAIRLLSVCFPLSGAPLGIAIGQITRDRGLSRNRALIFNECETWSHSLKLRNEL